MKIVVLGTRGFPNVQGGVEAHCQKLYPRLVRLGCEVTVFTRRPYVSKEMTQYKGVNLVSLSCPRNKYLETITHTFKGIFAAKRLKPDILHIHTIGPSILIPLARLLGLKTVMTNHGPDYMRGKWGTVGKCVLRLGERFGSWWAHDIIGISDLVADIVKKKYRRDIHVIPNGVEIPAAPDSDDALKRFSLRKGRYILTVGRFVPEKGLGDLIDAFEAAALRDRTLVIVGRADHRGSYSRHLSEKVEGNKKIVLTGFLTGKDLAELYHHAGIFVLPSHYEGLPIVLLEALSYGCSCLVSDIPPHRSIGLPVDWYFPVGKVGVLSNKLRELIGSVYSETDRERLGRMLRQVYNWDVIAEKTFEVYEGIVK